MISPKKFQDLTKTRYYNETDYWDNVVTPVLDGLGVPKGAHIRRREFPITTHWGDRSADWLIFVQNRPMLVIEAKQSEKDFEKARADAKTFAINFNPTKREDREVIREIRAIPYIFTPCGAKLLMFKLTILEDGITPDLHPLEGLLTYEELEKIAQRSVTFTGTRPLEENLLSTSQFRINFEEICNAIEKRMIPKAKIKLPSAKDSVVLVLNEILLASFQKQNRESIYERYKFTKKVAKQIEEVLNRYSLSQIEGPDLAYAYRDFVTRNFTGTTPWWAGKEEKEIGRYLTPAPVIKFMVDLCNPDPNDKVIDFACGSGGFLGAIASRMSSRVDIPKYLSENLFACDADPFSVSTAQTFMELLLPGKQTLAQVIEESFYVASLKKGSQISLDDVHPKVGITKPPRLGFRKTKRKGILNIFHHNGLFSEKIHSWEYNLSSIIPERSFDLVISNPPGGTDYNLEHGDELKKLFPLERKKLQNAPLFIQRAIQLAKIGGKICLIVPDGVLANIELQYLQEYIFNTCQVEGVISLPRGIFPNVSSKMSILYMIKTKTPSIKKPIFMASVETGEEIDLESELKKILENYKQFKYN
ncbi:MAG: N-6 DNA methylase [bacterium]|nr:N-6 DNA methylase [bacterium]